MIADLNTSFRDNPMLIRRMRFVPETEPGQNVFREFRRPQRSFVVCDQPTAEPGSPAAGDELLFALFPAAPAAIPDRRQEAQQWVAAACAGKDGMVEVAGKDGRVLWMAGRAAFLGSPERADEMLAVLIEFAFIEGQIRRLEADVEAAWGMARGDIQLTHEVAQSDVNRWPHVNEMTRRITLCRMNCCDLECQLRTPSVELLVTAQQILPDLTVRARLADRLAALDARIEVLMKLYALANDRLSAYSYFRREWWLEIWIILVIVVEMAAIFVQMWSA